MLNCNEIIKIALDNDVNIDDELEEEYYETLESISEDKKRISNLINELQKNVEQIDEKNIFKVINLIESIINGDNDSKEEIYDFALMLLYMECCINVSVPYRIIRIMISIEEDLDKIFLDIIEKTNENNIISVIITLNTLYSPIGNLNKIDDKLVVKLLEKVKNAVINNNNELLKSTIKQQLCEKINNDKYKRYFEEFNTLIY